MEQSFLRVRYAGRFGCGVGEPSHARRMAERKDRLEIGDACEGERHVVEARCVRSGMRFRLRLQEALPNRFALDRVEKRVSMARERLGNRRIELTPRALF